MWIKSHAFKNSDTPWKTLWQSRRKALWRRSEEGGAAATKKDSTNGAGGLFTRTHMKETMSHPNIWQRTRGFVQKQHNLGLHVQLEHDAWTISAWVSWAEDPSTSFSRQNNSDKKSGSCRRDETIRNVTFTAVKLNHLYKIIYSLWHLGVAGWTVGTLLFRVDET